MQEQQIKEKIKERYGKIALTGTETCCAPTIEFKGGKSGSSCCSPSDSATVVGYESKELESIPKASVLGVGCGAPLHPANVREGETVVDLGSGAGIDVFLSANKVGGSGKVIGIDLTDEMLEKARRNAKESGYTNVEFRKGDIEKRIPVDDNSVDLVISNCVINLTTNKVDTFKEVHRILKTQGRMVISDLVTDKEVSRDSIDSDKWCNCIDGALTKENYLESIRKAGFQNPEILEEKLYTQEESDNKVDGKRKIGSIVVKAVKI
ncbi:MAG TPA: arsenite methyltransferase [Nitrososphaeraceae archaeon]|nr:arsenite methyltransferase [Nitrososphaeraceae archaeon]